MFFAHIRKKMMLAKKNKLMLTAYKRAQVAIITRIHTKCDNHITQISYTSTGKRVRDNLFPAQA